MREEEERAKWGGEEEKKERCVEEGKTANAPSKRRKRMKGKCVTKKEIDYIFSPNIY